MRSEPEIVQFSAAIRKTEGESCRSADFAHETSAIRIRTGGGWHCSYQETSEIFGGICER